MFRGYFRIRETTCSFRHTESNPAFNTEPEANHKQNAGKIVSQTQRLSYKEKGFSFSDIEQIISQTNSL